jgi:hypothetical protein
MFRAIQSGPDTLGAVKLKRRDFITAPVLLATADDVIASQ